MAFLVSEADGKPSAAGPARPKGLWQSEWLCRWHLCSLDAPSVAVLWTWFALRAERVRSPPLLLSAMGLFVWALYVLDRLLDANQAAMLERPDSLQARHFFHYRYRSRFRAAAACSCLAATAFAAELPKLLLVGYALQGGLLALWFAWLHGRGSKAAALPKELIVGVIFSAAVFWPVLLRSRSAGTMLPAVLFAGLLTLNGEFISMWERHTKDRTQVAGWTAALGTGSLFCASYVRPTSRPLFAACACSCGLLLLLHHWRLRIDPTTLRAGADAALLTPLVLLPFLPR